MLELDCVYVNKQSSKYARILNVSDAVHTTRSQITEQLQKQRRTHNTVKHFRRSVWQKKQCQSAGAQPESFQGMEGFVELGHFDKHFIKNARKKKTFCSFSPG